MSTKRYRLTGDNFEMTVEIDHAVLTEAKLHEINNFWSNATPRIAEAGGSVLKAVLTMLFNTVQAVQMDKCGLTLQGVINHFAWTDAYGNRKNGEEGWPEMDGSHGIRIVDCWDEVDVDTNPMISEVTQ